MLVCNDFDLRGDLENEETCGVFLTIDDLRKISSNLVVDLYVFYPFNMLVQSRLCNRLHQDL